MAALVTSKEVETVVRTVLAQEGYRTSAERAGTGRRPVPTLLLKGTMSFSISRLLRLSRRRPRGQRTSTKYFFEPCRASMTG